MSFTTGIGGGHANPGCSEVQCVCKNISSLSISIWTAAQIGDESTFYRKAEKNKKLLTQFDDYGYTPLHYAAQNGHERLVEFLLKENVPVDAESCGATPLHRAVSGGNLRCVQLLVNAGANINAVDKSFGDGNTPAHKALLYQRSEIFQFLLQKGAITSIPNSQGYTVDQLIHDTSSLQPMQENSVDEANPSYAYCRPISTSLSVNNDAKSNHPPLEVPRCWKCHRESLSFYRNKKGNLICSECRRFT